LRPERDNSGGLDVGQRIAKNDDCIGVLGGGRGKCDIEFCGRGRIDAAVQLFWGADPRLD
jgi:hypothetical protein